MELENNLLCLITGYHKIQINSNNNLNNHNKINNNLLSDLKYLLLNKDIQFN